MICMLIAAVIGIGAGLWIYLWRQKHLSVERRRRLEDRQLALEDELHHRPDAALAAELAAITRRLDAYRRRIYEKRKKRAFH